MSFLSDPSFLIVIACFTSALTAALGLGGGVMLLAVMPLYMPFTAAIPLHGAVQMASNLSRFLVDIKQVRWEYVPIYFVGALVGVVLGYLFLGKIPETYLPLGLGVFILLVTWTQLVKRLGKLLGNLGVVASVQAFFSLFIGSTGLISPPILLQKGLSKDEVIVTHSVHMTIMHSFKIAAFMAAGVAFWEYGALIAGMILASIVGSWGGGKLRRFIPEKQGKAVLKLLITLLAFKLMSGVL